MTDYRLRVLAVAALSLGLAGEAAAGGCCSVFETGVPPAESYMVNQGPVFSGPGHAIRRQFPDPVPPPGAYPYVGYVYTGYPYGLQGSAGYPRGFYNPTRGYPYADPPPYIYRAYHGYPR